MIPVAQIGVSAVGVMYYLTIGKWFWRKSSLRNHQKAGKIIPCPICGSSKLNFCCSIPIYKNMGLFDARGLARRAYNLEFLPNGKLRTKFKEWEKFVVWPGSALVDYYRCLSCHVFFQNHNMNSEARGAFYAVFYRSAKRFGRSHANLPGSRFHLWAEYLRSQTGLKRGARILDVGCAEGFLVQRLKDMGYEAYGIDPSKPMIRYGQEELGLDNLTSESYNDRSYPENFFDLVTTYHVIEHVDDHEAFLHAMCLHLKPGGYLLVSTPCPEAAYEQLESGIPVRMLKNVFGGGHYILFSRRYLWGILEKKGLGLIGYEIVNKKSLLLENKKISASGEKWLGMNIIAKKYS